MTNLVPFNASLPLLGIGFVSLFLSLIFCCYMWRLRHHARREKGYRRIQYKPAKIGGKANDTCPVCLEEFVAKEHIAICPCQHCFHMKCLLLWLQHQNSCPMCKAPVQSPSVDETSTLVNVSRSQPSQSQVAPAVWQESV